MRLTCFLSFLSAFLVVQSVGQASEIHLKINVGGTDVGDWKGDASFAEGGQKYSFKGEHSNEGIDDAAPNQVYETVRHQRHGFSFPDLPDGKYLLRLHFSDKFADANRKMVYRAEGEIVIDGFSPWIEADRETMRVVTREVEIEVSDGNGLQIDALPGEGTDVFEAALEVVGLDVKMADRLSKEAVSPKPSAPQISDPVRNLTNRPTRLVWAQILKDPAKDHNATVPGNSILVGYDTEDGKGERVIMEKPGAYGMPMLTPDGRQIVYSDRKRNRWYLVNFDGSQLREMAEGFASDLWQDPATDHVWVYVRTPSHTTSARIERMRLDDPATREVVFENAPVGHPEIPWFQVSADGKVAADAFPWPKCGVAYLDQQNSWEAKGNGCWTSMAADNSYRMMHFLGVHTELAVYEYGSKSPLRIKLDNIPGIEGQKVYHPRWGENNPGYITVTGPQWQSSTEVYLGKFDSTMSRVEEWVKVSSNNRADSYGDVWIHQNTEDKARAAVAKFAPTAPQEPEWPLAKEDLLWLWENNLAHNQVNVGGHLQTCDIKFRSGAVLTTHQGLDLIEGWAHAEEPGDRIVKACQRSQEFTLEMTLTATSSDPRNAIVMGMINPSGKARNFALLQKQNELIFEIRHSESKATEFSLGTISLDEPQHVMLTKKNGEVTAWINGKKTVSEAGIGSFDNWLSSPTLVFGGEKRGDRWEGLLEGIAIFAHAMTEAEIAQSNELALSRALPEDKSKRVIVSARVKEISGIPDPKEIDYPRSLGRDLWEIKSVEQGSLEAGEIAVTRWVILDRELVPGAAELKVGDTATLKLEPYDERPELAGEHQTNSLSVFDVPVFHRVH